MRTRSVTSWGKALERLEAWGGALGVTLGAGLGLGGCRLLVGNIGDADFDIVAAGIVYFAGLWAGERAIGALESYLRSAQPCRHGVRGGAMDQALCTDCVSDAAAEEKRIRRTEIEAARARAKDEHAAFAEYKGRLLTPATLTSMDPFEFERVVCAVYRGMGCRVENTPRSKDGGADGLVWRGKSLFVLQCKRVKSRVGEPVLRDLYGTLTALQARGGIVVTTGKVSRQARHWARGKPIEIVEMPELLALLRQHLHRSSFIE